MRSIFQFIIEVIYLLFHFFYKNTLNNHFIPNNANGFFISSFFKSKKIRKIYKKSIKVLKKLLDLSSITSIRSTRLIQKKK